MKIQDLKPGNAFVWQGHVFIFMAQRMNPNKSPKALSILTGQVNYFAHDDEVQVVTLLQRTDVEA